MLIHYSTTKSEYFTTYEVKEGANTPDLTIDETKLDQKVLGFGGAITNSVSYVYSEMSSDLQKEFLDLVYSDSGLAYSYARIPIGTCDFNKEDYNYASKEDLSDFTIHPYEDKTISLLNRIKKEYHPLSLMGSVWSPLPFYKCSKKKVGGRLLKQYYPSHALYLAKYLEQMHKSGVDFSFISINNEPRAKVPWESCFYSAQSEASFARVLDKTLKEHNLPVSLATYDHNRDLLLDWVCDSFTKYKSSDLFSYIAFHWYDNKDYENVRKVHELYPEKTLVFSEGCIESLTKENRGEFSHPVRYFKNYLRDLNSGASIFLDWNILLDSNGGPNHVGNYCESPIMYDEDSKKLLVNPPYYAIKHFSFFLKDGYRRVIAPSIDSPIELACFYNEEKCSIVLLILNESDTLEFTFSVFNHLYKVTLKANSLNTIIIGKE